MSDLVTGREFDVLVIGGGLAAMRAALAASGSGARTGLVLKGVLGESGSSAIAGGGLAAVMDVSDVPEDSVEKHYEDTLVSGDYVNDPELVRTLVENAGASIRELEQIGAKFVAKSDGEIEVFLATPDAVFVRRVEVDPDALPYGRDGLPGSILDVALGNFATVNTVMADYFEQPYPARAAVGVASLPKGADVEAEAVLAL